MSGPNARFKDQTGSVVKERFKEFIISFTPGGAEKEDQDGTTTMSAMSQFKVSPLSPLLLTSMCALIAILSFFPYNH
jgi:hypothetical protein